MADARVSAATVEALTDGTPERRVSAVNVEVLTAAALVTTVYLRTAGSARPVQVKLADASWAPVRVVGP